jgi:UV DNA damage endonuclease
MKTRLGYCCISLGDGHKSAFKTITLSNAQKLKDQAAEKIKAIWQDNLQELVAVLDYNINIGVPLYRLSSNLFPLADHIDYSELWKNFRETKANFKQVKTKIKSFLSLGGRLGAHPSQFVSLGCSNKTTRDNSRTNLEFHGEMFDAFGLPNSSEASLNIHLSSGSKAELHLPYFYDSLKKLSTGVSSRLVFETEDKGHWTWQAIQKRFPDYPITLDFHHWRINNRGESLNAAFEACVASWKGARPLMHISEGRTKPLDRAHSDWVETLPLQVLDHAVDLEIEAKKKDLALLNLMKLYKDNIYVFA